MSSITMVHRFNVLLNDLHVMMTTDNEPDLVETYLSLHDQLFAFYIANSRRITKIDSAQEQEDN